MKPTPANPKPVFIGCLRAALMEESSLVQRLVGDWELVSRVHGLGFGVQNFMLRSSGLGRL